MMFLRFSAVAALGPHTAFGGNTAVPDTRSNVITDWEGKTHVPTRSSRIEKDGVVSFVYEFPNGETYEGRFIDGKMHGQGKYTFPNGDTYEGRFIDGKMQGQGKYTLSNEETYEGQFIDGKLHDQEGKYTLPNGDTYKGEFRMGKQHGRVVKKNSEDQVLIDAEWEHGQVVTGWSYIYDTVVEDYGILGNKRELLEIHEWKDGKSRVDYKRGVSEEELAKDEEHYFPLEVRESLSFPLENTEEEEEKFDAELSNEERAELEAELEQLFQEEAVAPDQCFPSETFLQEVLGRNIPMDNTSRYREMIEQLEGICYEKTSDKCKLSNTNRMCEMKNEYEYSEGTITQVESKLRKLEEDYQLEQDFAQLANMMEI